ncbi:hypothetical protein [Treponema sp.]|uniref:hypothetical protein n=1 Tax=Treponema sp. TaxID=166 RepID=UPI003F0E6FDD
MTEEEFAEVNDIFDKCGFSRITKVEKEDTLNTGAACSPDRPPASLLREGL